MYSAVIFSVLFSLRFRLLIAASCVAPVYHGLPTCMICFVLSYLLDSLILRNMEYQGHAYIALLQLRKGYSVDLRFVQ